MAHGDASFIYYYQTELAYYRELAQEFGREHPEVAHLVSERGGDDAADRMFQGAALLTARLRQRVEDDFPEVIHPLFDQLWPQFLRPIPALTLLEFTPLPGALRQSQPIPAGTLVRSAAVSGLEGKGIVCPFRTCQPVWLHPLQLEEAGLHRPQAADLQLRLRLTVAGGARLGQLSLPPLRLQLVGDPRTKLTLYGLLGRTRGISVQSGSGEVRFRLPAAALRQVGFEASEALCPFSPTPKDGLSLLQEYFLFPDKFLAVELSGLDQLPEDLELQSFELVFHLGAVEQPELRLDRESFSLCCVPAVNLSEAQRIDLRIVPGESRYLLPLPHPGAEIFQVEKVRVFDRDKNDWLDCPPLHATAVPEADRPCFVVTRSSDVVEGIETFIDVVDVDGNPLCPPGDVLQVFYATTNGALAARLEVGAVSQPSPSSPELATFRNVLPVTPGLPLGLGRERFWRLLAKLNMHPAELCTQEGLELLIDEAEGGRSSGGGPEILSLTVGTASRLYRRTVSPMRQVQVELADASFLCEGQLYLFARVLERLFVGEAGSAVFCQTTVRGSPSGVTHRFAPR